MENIFLSITIVAFILMLVALVWPKKRKPRQPILHIEPILPHAMKIKQQTDELSKDIARQLFHTLRNK